MIKLVIINESFHSSIWYRRWQLLSQAYSDLDVTLLTTDVCTRFANKAYTFGKAVEYHGQLIDEDRFHIRLFKAKGVLGLGWISKDFKPIIKEIQPDIIYNIGTHNQMSLYQLIHIRNSVSPKSRLFSFSMRGPGHNISNLKSKDYPAKRYLKRRFLYYPYAKVMLKYFNRNCDAVFCHYPKAVECFRDEGYKGPVFMQTQVGVNPERIYPNEEYRNEIRNLYGIKDQYVFGSAIRFTDDKGVFEMIDAMPADMDWRFLLMGSGTDSQNEQVRERIKARGLEDKIILTGFISDTEMPKYWNAVDCAIHFPKTTSTWVETFSLSVVQAMATRKPVVGSDSGSVPYQLGPDGIVVPEGDVQALNEKLVWVLNHREDCDRIAGMMYDRAISCFSIQHLNELFYNTLKSLISGNAYDK